MITSNSLFNNPYESSIRQLLKIDSRQKLQLQNEQKDLRGQKKALSSIDSKLSSLDSLLASFTELPGEKIRPLNGTSSNPEAVSVVSTSGLDNPGNYNIEVSQLAKEDIVLSDAIDQTGSDFNTAGVGTFDIAIGSEDATSINVNTDGLNNQEALEAIASKVNDELGDKVNASVFKLGDGTSRLSFKSLGSGEANRITVSNRQADFSSLALTNEFTPDELNAKFTIDNVTFQRSSNLVDDAIEGFTFELKGTTTQTEHLKIERDVEGARKNIDDFISKFNDANSIIRNKTFLDGDTGERGPLQNQRTVRNLSFKLRQAVSLPVNSLSDNPINSLKSMGIELDRDGSMKVKDSAALDEALKKDPEAVSNLFSADDGIAASVQQEIGLYISDNGSDGIFKSIGDGINRKIDRLDTRIEREDKYLVRREQELRDQFAELDKVITQGQQQYNQVLSFQGRMGF